jgi:N-acetylglutamate synthase-like GNAT family acetyltransferase
MEILEYTDHYNDQVIDLILTIQRQEFGVNITVADQPDLAVIPGFYQQKNGNFWIVKVDEEVTGTIALMDIGNHEVALRKMFVHSQYRGKEKGVAQALMNKVIQWCRLKNVSAIYLGTIDVMKAAHRFYEKNRFHQINRTELPPGFVQMKVDNVFYKLTLDQ